MRAVSIFIAVVGLFYHCLSAHLMTLTGISFWADHSTHPFVPIPTDLWWLTFAPKTKVRKSDFIIWVARPMLYVVYAVIPGSFSNFYRSPAIDVPTIGWEALLINVIVFSLGFVILGWSCLPLDGFCNALDCAHKHISC